MSTHYPTCDKQSQQKNFLKNLLFLSQCNKTFGDVLVLHTPIIKYIFEIYLGLICIAVDKNGKENIEGFKTVQLNTVVVTLWYI